MLVKVLIKRRFLKGKEKEVKALMNEFRAGAMNRPGYISGVTMTKYDDPLTLMVIATWESVEDWMAWKDSDTRKRFDQMIEIYQKGSTEYETFVMGTPNSLT